MITKRLIEGFIDSKSSTVRQIFSAIVGQPEGSGAHNGAIVQASSLLEAYGYRHSLISPVPSEKFSFIHQFPLGEIEVIANAESERSETSIGYILLIKPFKRFWIGFIAKYLGLDPIVMNGWNTNDKDSYCAVGDGVFWAGLYLIVSKD